MQSVSKLRKSWNRELMIVIVAGKTVKGPVTVSIEGAEHTFPAQCNDGGSS